MNSVIATISSRRRPKLSESLPYSGVVTVDTIRYAVTIHDRWPNPFRSLAMAGTAGITTVWSSAASRMHSTMPPMTRMMARWSWTGDGIAWTAGADDDIADTGTRQSAARQT
ncbi:hypothetical protein D9M68_766840 [compost metagenome]